MHTFHNIFQTAADDIFIWAMGPQHIENNVNCDKLH